MNSLCNLKLFLNGEETLFPGENAAGNEIPEGANKKEKTSRFEVASRNQLKPPEIGVNHKDAKNGKAYGDDAKFTWETAGRAGGKRGR